MKDLRLQRSWTPLLLRCDLLGQQTDSGRGFSLPPDPPPHFPPCVCVSPVNSIVHPDGCRHLPGAQVSISSQRRSASGGAGTYRHGLNLYHPSALVEFKLCSCETPGVRAAVWWWWWCVSEAGSLRARWVLNLFNWPTKSQFLSHVTLRFYIYIYIYVFDIYMRERNRRFGSMFIK